MTDSWGTIISQDADYANVPGGSNLELSDQVSSYQMRNSGINLYQSLLGFMSVDTSELVGTPDELYLTRADINDYPAGSTVTINIAEYDFGPTLTTADWLDPTALSALTVIGSYTTDPDEGNVDIFIPLDMSGLTLGGELKFVIFTDDQASETPPIDDGNFGVQGVNVSTAGLLARTFAVDPGAVSTYTTEVAADSPELWWRFDETSGTIAADSSGNGNDGTYKDVTLARPGLIPGDPSTAIDTTNAFASSVTSGSFDGTDFSGTGLTMEVIFVADDVTDNIEYYQVIGFGVDDYLGIDTYWVDAVSNRAFFNVYRSEGDTNEVVYGFVEPYVVTHIVFTVPSDGSVNRSILYINGDIYQSVLCRNVDQSPRTIPTFLGDVGDVVPFIGASDGYDPGGSPPYSPGYTDAMTGTLDEAALYFSELNPTRVAKHFKASGAGYTTLTAAPTVTGVSPASGFPVGGVVVTITGTDFDGVTEVNFGATPATSWSRISSTEIDAVSPAHADGNIHVTVVNPIGTSAESVADVFTYFQPSWVDEITADTPTFWWRFDETSGTVAEDSSGNGNDGTYEFSHVSAPGLLVGDPSSAILYDTPDYAVVSTPVGPSYLPQVLTEFSLEILVSLGDLTGQNAIFGSNQFSPMIWAHPSFFFGVTRSNGVFSFGLEPQLDTTYHLVLTWNGSTERFFVDGVEVANYPDSNPNVVDNQFYVGPIGFTTDPGTYDEALFYDYPLTGERVYAHWAASAYAPSPLGPPEVISITPDTGAIYGGLSASIVGVGFTGATAVYFGTDSAAFTVVNNTHITVFTPGEPLGPVDVTVVNASGASNAVTFTYVAIPPPPPPPADTPQAERFAGAGSSNPRAEIVPVRMPERELARYSSSSNVSESSSDSGLTGEVSVNVSNTRCVLNPVSDFAVSGRGTVDAPNPSAYRTAVMNSDPTLFWRYEGGKSVYDIFGGIWFYGTTYDGPVVGDDSQNPAAKPPLNTYPGASQQHRGDLGDTYEQTEGNIRSAASQTWVNNAGQWAIWEYDYSEGFYAKKWQFPYPATTGVSISTVETFQNVNVQLSFTGNPPNGSFGGPDYYSDVGVVFRYTDNNNYWRATILGAYVGGGLMGTVLVTKVQAGVETLQYVEDVLLGRYYPGYFGTKLFKIEVSCFEDKIYVFSPNLWAPAIRSLRGDPGVITITDSFNQTATRSGLYANRFGTPVGNPPWPGGQSFIASPVGLSDSSGNSNDGEVWGLEHFARGFPMNLHDYKQEGTGFRADSSFQLYPPNNLAPSAWSSLQACYLKSFVTVPAPWTMETLVYFEEENNIIMASGRTHGIAVGQGGTPGLSSEFKFENVNPTFVLDGGYGPEIIVVVFDGTRPAEQFPTGVYAPSGVSHLAVTYDGTTVKVYLGGKLIYDADHPGVVSTGGFTVGGFEDQYGKVFVQDFFVDETALYDHVLSEATIQNHVAAAYETVSGIGPAEVYAMDFTGFRSEDDLSPFKGFTVGVAPFAGTNYGMYLRQHFQGNNKVWLTLYQVNDDGTIKAGFGTIDITDSGFSSPFSSSQWASLGPKTIVMYVGFGQLMAVNRAKETLTYDTFEMSIPTVATFFYSRVNCFKLDDTHFFVTVTTPFEEQRDWAICSVEGTTITEVATGTFVDVYHPVNFPDSGAGIPEIWFATSTHLIGTVYNWDVPGSGQERSLIAIPYSTAGTLGTPYLQPLPLHIDPGGNTGGPHMFYERFESSGGSTDFLISFLTYDPPDSYDNPVDSHLIAVVWDGSTFTIGDEVNTDWGTSFSSTVPWTIGQYGFPDVGFYSVDCGPTPGNTHIMFGYADPEANYYDDVSLSWQEWTQTGTSISKTQDWRPIPGTYAGGIGSSGSICLHPKALVIPYSKPVNGDASLVAMAFDGTASGDNIGVRPGATRVKAVDSIVPIRMKATRTTATDSGGLGENDPFLPTVLRSISVTPSTAPVGYIVTLEGWGWPPGEHIGVSSEEVQYGQTLFTPFYIPIFPTTGVPSPQVFATVDGNGYFSADFVVPDSDGHGNQMVGPQRISVTLRVVEENGYDHYIRAGCFFFAQQIEEGGG